MSTSYELQTEIVVEGWALHNSISNILGIDLTYTNGFTHFLCRLHLPMWAVRHCMGTSLCAQLWWTL